MTHGQCDARPTVIFPAAGHHHPTAPEPVQNYTSEARVCEQLAQGCYMKAGSRTRDLHLRSHKSNTLTTTPPGRTIGNCRRRNILLDKLPLIDHYTHNISALAAPRSACAGIVNFDLLPLDNVKVNQRAKYLG